MEDMSIVGCGGEKERKFGTQLLLNRQGASPLLNFGDGHPWSNEGVVVVIFVFGRSRVNSR